MSNPYPPTPMPQYPNRDQPRYNEPGNPFSSGPNMQHPGTNPVGRLPAPAQPRGAEFWSGRQSQQFASDGTNQVWTWQSALFDLRPGINTAMGWASAAVPINHEGALGLNIYLNILIGTVTGVRPIASTPGLRAEYWEVGNNVNADNTQLMTLTQVIEISDQVLAGGTSTTFPFGASPVSFTPCVIGLCYWQVFLRLTIEGVGAVTEPYFINARLH
jgi:hypothetical protein